MKAPLKIEAYGMHGYGMDGLMDGKHGHGVSMKDIKAMALGPIKKVEGIKCMHAWRIHKAKELGMGTRA